MSEINIRGNSDGTITETKTLITWSLQIISHEPEPVLRYSESDKRVLSNLPAMLEAIEEDLTLILPEGYSAKITTNGDTH